eukprot:11082131-Lingulodinium_polyedra.AAC.1
MFTHVILRIGLSCPGQYMLHFGGPGKCVGLLGLGLLLHMQCMAWVAQAHWAVVDAMGLGCGRRLLCMALPWSNHSNSTNRQQQQLSNNSNSTAVPL